MTPKQSLGCIASQLAIILIITFMSIGYYGSKLQELQIKYESEQLKYKSEHIRTRNLAHMLKLVDAERNAFGYANLQLIKSCEPKKLDKAISATPLPPMEYRMQTRKIIPILKENQ